MKRKILTGILVAFIIPLILSGQSETFYVAKAKFSSKKYDEFSPVYYNGGLVFCTNKTRNLISNYQTSENKGLFKINYVDIGFQGDAGKPRLFTKSLITRFNDGPASFTKNGDTIYFSRNLRVDGPVNEIANPRNKLGIFMAVLEGNKWGKITDLRFNNEYYNITTPYISPDGKRLFFASDNPDGHGGSDLYYCDWKGDFWDDPVNLGPVVNTSGNESYPFVNSEGGLYFSSDGHPGSGGKDIFYTKQSGGKWLPPVHLDAPINSQYDDFGIVADSVMNSGYFSSNRGGTTDIYSFKTRIHQLYYCDNVKANQYCFRFTDEAKIPVDERYLQLGWDFGDGGKAAGLNVEHCYSGPGKYNVKLEAIDKKTGEVFFSKLSYVLTLSDFEQPIIKCPASSLPGESINFDGLSSNFPGSDILVYTWNFGDGGRSTGEKVSHTFREKGDYEVLLGLIVRNKTTGIIKNECVSKPFKVFVNKAEKVAFEKRVVKPSPPVNVFDYEQARIEDLYSSEKEFSQDMVFQVEAFTSKVKLMPDNKLLTGIPSKYAVREIFLSENRLYSYIVAEENNLMATYPAFNDIRNLGYKTAVIKAITLEDPAAKELNNLKKVFGESADLFFRKNDFTLTSAGTQLLDLIMGFMAKYPEIRLEIANHTDNLGNSAANQALTQKRSEAMANYLVVNGVSQARLVAKGYGGSRPVSSNILEADRKFNRRIDFRILK